MGGGGGRGGYGDDRYQKGGGKRTDFRVIVTNLPERTRWVGVLVCVWELVGRFFGASPNPLPIHTHTWQC